MWRSYADYTLPSRDTYGDIYYLEDVGPHTDALNNFDGRRQCCGPRGRLCRRLNGQQQDAPPCATLERQAVHPTQDHPMACTPSSSAAVWARQHALLAPRNIPECTGRPHLQRFLRAFAAPGVNHPLACKLPVKQHVALGTLVEALLVVYPRGNFAAEIPRLHARAA